MLAHADFEDFKFVKASIDAKCTNFAVPHGNTKNIVTTQVFWWQHDKVPSVSYRMKVIGVGAPSSVVEYETATKEIVTHCLRASPKEKGVIRLTFDDSKSTVRVTSLDEMPTE